MDARPMPRAIARSDTPFANPGEISSSSASDSLNAEQTRSRFVGRVIAIIARCDIDCDAGWSPERVSG